MVMQLIPRAPGTYVIPTIEKENETMTGHWKTILVVGETGCDKTTILNSFVNYLWGVQMTDHYRFVLVPPSSATGARVITTRRTSDVTPYHLRPPSMLHGLTIVDTPALGDKNGKESHKKLVDKIEHVFKQECDTIDAIFFIVRSSGRLNSEMKHVLDSILGLFGKDVETSFFAIATDVDHDEGATPILEPLKGEAIPVQETFEIKESNAAFFTGFEPKKARRMQQYLRLGPCETHPEFPLPTAIREHPETQMLWDDGMKATQKMFEVLDGTSPCSLTLSMDKLKLRKDLQLKIVQLNKEARKGLNKVDDLRQKMFDTLKSQGEENSEVRKETVKVDTKDGMSEELTCDKKPPFVPKTCEEGVASDAKKDSSIEATGDGRLKISHGIREESADSKDDSAVKAPIVKAATAIDEASTKSDVATSVESLRKDIVATIRKEITTELDNVKTTIADLHHSLLKLQRIASCRGVMTIKECYEKLIQSEEAERTSGWKTRVVTLKLLMKEGRTSKQVLENERAESVIFQSATLQVQEGVWDVEGAGRRSKGAVPTPTVTAVPLPGASLPTQSASGCSHSNGTYTSCTPTCAIVVMMVFFFIFFWPLTFLPLVFPCLYEKRVYCKDCHQRLRTEPYGCCECC